MQREEIRQIGIQTYESRMYAARSQFAANPALATIMDPAIDRDLLELFFITFNALGVQMTEPVEGWINRSGAQCQRLGLHELGAALQRHARHEANHHLMMIEDTKKLVDRRNARRSEQLDARDLIERPATAGIARYVELHEKTIAGDAPYAQIAIEYEIERLSNEYGRPLLEHCAALLGKDILENLSFIEDHVALDAGHTKFNAAELARLLHAYPDKLEALCQRGAEALEAYGMFLQDALALAKTMLRS